MFDDIRILKWHDGILKFPCGVKVEITAEKLAKVFTMFKLEDEIKNIIEKGEATLKKGRAFQIKAYLT